MGRRTIKTQDIRVVETNAWNAEAKEETHWILLIFQKKIYEKRQIIDTKGWKTEEQVRQKI